MTHNFNRDLRARLARLGITKVTFRHNGSPHPRAVINIGEHILSYVIPCSTSDSFRAVHNAVADIKRLIFQQTGIRLCRSNATANVRTRPRQPRRKANAGIPTLLATGSARDLIRLERDPWEQLRQSYPPQRRLTRTAAMQAECDAFGTHQE